MKFSSQQTGRASWYSLDSPTASGEKPDDMALARERCQHEREQL
jgi:rare lipoprotein A (peptidoglycan hydrolase)